MPLLQQTGSAKCGYVFEGLKGRFVTAWGEAPGSN